MTLWKLFWGTVLVVTLLIAFTILGVLHAGGAA